MLLPYIFACVKWCKRFCRSLNRSSQLVSTSLIIWLRKAVYNFCCGDTAFLQTVALLGMLKIHILFPVSFLERYIPIISFLGENSNACMDI